jgi:hypothetical protein
MSMSDYLERKVLDLTLRGIPFDPPTTIYIALLKSDSGDGNALDEVSGGDYERQEIVFGEPENGVASNVGHVVFPEATGNWGTVTDFALMDAPVGGNKLYGGRFAVPKLVEAYDQYRIKSGTAKVTID